MTDEIIIREFNDTDIPEMANLMIELGYPTTSTEMVERINNFRTNPDYKTLVAERNNKIIGVIGMMKLYFWEQNKWYVKIQALVVKQTVRKHGVGELLIKSSEVWAKEIGAICIALNCGNKAERSEAHKFYPKMGFQHKSSGYIKFI